MKLITNLPDIDNYVALRKLTDPKTEERIISSLVGNFSVTYPKVKDALTADDFSSEQWRYYYKAIQTLAANGTPIDTVSVEHALRRMGKYDASGGDMTIATMGLQYEEDISHLGDIVVQLSIRRQAIARFSSYIDKASSETVDMSALLGEAAADMQHFSENFSPRSKEDKMQELANEMFVTEQPAVVPPLVTIDQTPVVKRGDHTLVSGPKKSRKSLFLTHLICEYIKNSRGNGSRVVVFDTEQDRSDVWKGRERIRKATGALVEFANMRGRSPKARRDFISWVASKRPLDIIVIDGIRDCMVNFLDVQETTEVVTWLEDLTVSHQLAIINVLHHNKSKTDSNARGHIGTELTNKAIANIEVTLDEKTGHSIVKCESSRHAPFESFSFTHSRDGNYDPLGSVASTTTEKGDLITKPDKQRRLETIFEDQTLSAKLACEGISSYFNVSIRRAQQLLAEYVLEGICLKEGKPGTKSVSYKLSATAFLAPLGVNYNGNGHAPVVPEPQPAPLFQQNGHDPIFQPTEDLPF